MPPTLCSVLMSIYVIMGVLTKTTNESATFVRFELMTVVFAADVGDRFTFDIKIISFHVGGEYERYIPNST